MNHVEVTYEQARAAARVKTGEANWGSPFRYELTRRVPALIAHYCPREAAVLDVGCGSGRYVLFLVDAGITGTYTGLDISDDRWDELPLPTELPGMRLMHDAHRLDELDTRFDFVLSLTAFEHFKEDHRVARGVAAVLKPGACALIAVPSHASHPLYGEHGFRRYSSYELRNLATGAGLEVVALEPVSGLLGWLFHFFWFVPAEVFRQAGKAALFVAAGLDKPRAQRRWPRVWQALDDLGQHHLRWAWGRALHHGCLAVASVVDRLLPVLSVGYLSVWRRPEA